MNLAHIEGTIWYGQLRRPLLVDQIMDCPNCRVYAKHLRFAINYSIPPEQLRRQISGV